MAMMRRLAVSISESKHYNNLLISDAHCCMFKVCFLETNVRAERYGVMFPTAHSLSIQSSLSSPTKDGKSPVRFSFCAF